MIEDLRSDTRFGILWLELQMVGFEGAVTVDSGVFWKYGMSDVNVLWPASKLSYFWRPLLAHQMY
jgi:hypothetical protein